MAAANDDAHWIFAARRSQVRGPPSDCDYKTAALTFFFFFSASFFISALSPYRVVPLSRLETVSLFAPFSTRSSLRPPDFEMFFLKGSSSNYSFRDSQSVKESSHDEEYIVEAILNKRKINRKVYYYLKWKNYSSRHNSWEPEANLDCDDLILEFENQLKCKKTKTNSQNRECSFLRSSSDSSFPDYGLFESGRESPSDVKVDECDEANEKMEGLDEVLIKKTNVQKRKYNISITANVTSLSEDVLSKKRRETIPSDQEVNKVYETCEKLENVEEFSKTDFIEQCNGKVEVGRFEWKNDLSFLTFDKISTLEGKEPEEVLHAFRPSDKLVLVVKWKGIVTPEFVLSEEFIVKYPQLAIKFYEKKITWG